MRGVLSRDDRAIVRPLLPDVLARRMTLRGFCDVDDHPTMSKVPAVTLGFWIIKIAATTLGETGGDTVTMTLNWGYLAGTALFLGLLVALVAAQILAKRFNPLLYW